jgi:hypothetical protein
VQGRASPLDDSYTHMSVSETERVFDLENLHTHPV